MPGTCQLFQAVDVLGEVFREFLFVLENLQEVVSGVRKVILAREELFCPRIESPWILPLSDENYFDCSKPEMIT